MDLQEILTFVNFQLNKHQSGNTLNADEFNACLKYANIEYLRVTIGLPETYIPGQAIPKIAAEQTERIASALRPFITWLGEPKGKAQLPINGGIGDLPEDYVQYSGIMYEDSTGYISQVEVLEDQFLADRLSSSLKKPTKYHPVSHIYNDKIIVYPNTINKIHFKYYRVPATPVYAVTIVDDQEVYDKSNSIQLEWPEIDHNNIVPLILQYAATNLRDNFIYQAAERRKQQGQ